MRFGPVGTLLVGGVLAAVFGGLSARAGPEDSGNREASGSPSRPAATLPSTVAPSATASRPASPPPKAPKVPEVGDAPAKGPAVHRAARAATGNRLPDSRAKHNYVGYTHGHSASVSFVVHGGKVVAYLCDGKAKAAWLRGSMRGGRLNLRGEHGAHLRATSENSKITGLVGAAGRSFRFTVVGVKRPSGLYRLSGDVRGAHLRGGWNVLPDGRQMGLLSTDGKAAPAPAIDLASGTVRVAGQDVSVQEVTP